jgi:SagB-type dehydrogenase family enzyme
MQRNFDKLLQRPAIDALSWETGHELLKLDNRQTSQRSTNDRILLFEAFPRIYLSELASLDMSLGEAFRPGKIPSRMRRQALDPAILATLLEVAGAPGFVEVFFHTISIKGLAPGIYHRPHGQNMIHRIRDGDHTAKLAAALKFKQLAVETSLILFLVGELPPSRTEQWERAYHHTLLNIGRCTQSLHLAARSLGLISVEIGEYTNRAIDDLIGIDGVTHASLHLVGIGHPEAETPKE